MFPIIRTASWKAKIDSVSVRQASAFGVELASTRTKLSSARLKYDGKVLRLERAGERVLHAELPVPPDTGEVLLEVSYIGERPLPTGVSWRSGTPGIPDSWYPDILWDGDVSTGYLFEVELARLRVPAEVLDQNAFARLVKRAESVTEARILSDVFQQRLIALEDDARIRGFFYRFDRGTAYALSSDRKRSVMEKLSYRMAGRIAIRQYLGSGQGSPTGAPEVPVFHPIDPSSYWRKYIRMLEEVSEHVKDRIEADLKGVRSYDLVDWAFEQFVTDGAAVSHYDPAHHGSLLSHGAPNSTEYLKMAELGFFCRENGVHEGFWGEHLPTFVRTTHIFLEHAVRRASPAPFPADPSEFGYEEGRYYPRTRRDELRVEYESLLRGARSPRQRIRLLEDRFTSLIGQGLQGTIQSSSRERRSPAAKPAVLKPSGL